MIEVNKLYTGYSRDKPLLSDFNYKFENKIYGILGKSGCGKTTFLRTLAGLQKPISGSISINDVPIRGISKDIYMMHQNYTSFDWKTCLDNVLITKQIKGIVTEQDIENAKIMLSEVGLKGYENKYPKQLSGGQRQRLALARTLFVNPDTILMDEPLSALDEDTRWKMQSLILKLHKKYGNTIILVTHSHKEANRMCDVIINL